MSNYGNPNCTHDPDDFGQLSINRGQRKINYKLNVVDMELVKAVTALRDAVANLTNSANPLIIAASNAITKADELSKVVADIRPPGCEGN